MKTKMRMNLRNYLTIFKSFGNCGVDDNYDGYWFKTTSEPESELYICDDYICDDYIRLREYGSSKTMNKLISRCDYPTLLEELKP